MNKIERILCPTDLSTDADDALQYAVALAHAYDAKLFLLHCSEARPVGEDENSSKVDTQMGRLFGTALVPYLNVVGPKRFCWEGVVRNGVYHIGKAIVQEAISQKIDLIVMHAQRRHRATIQLSATAETVCRSAPCPVLLIHNCGFRE